MNSTKSTIKLGIFITIGTICFIIGLYYLGTKQNLFGGTFEINAVFNNVNGLQKGNNVRFSGINVGTVKEVKIINDSSIEVNLLISDDVQQFIKIDAIASLGNDGLMGNKLVNISPGKSSAKVIEEGGYLLSINELDADDMLRRLEQTNRNISLITSSLVDITEKINQGKGSMGILLNNNEFANNLTKTMANINDISNNTSLLSKKISKSLGNIESSENTIGLLLNDTVFTNEIKNTVSELQSFGANTEKISEELKLIVEEIQMGKGTMGTLLSDSIANANVKQSLYNLQEGSKAFNENMEALKHNFLFRRYFKKIEKEKLNNKSTN